MSVFAEEMLHTLIPAGIPNELVAFNLQRFNLVRNIHTTGGKRYDFQSGEVWPLENINLEVLSPRKLLDQFRSPVDKGLVLCAELFVDDGSESCSPNLISKSEPGRVAIQLTFPFGAAAVRIDVRLDEANVRFDDGSDILYPLLRSFFVSIDRSSLEARGRVLSTPSGSLCDGGHTT